jgi:hypothetical protein
MRAILAALIAASFLALPAGAQAPANTTVKVAQAPDVVWAKAVRYLATRSISPEALDKEAGTITASGPTKQGEWLKCEFQRGIVHDVRYKLMILIDKAEDGGSIVTVAMSGEAQNARRRRFIIIPVGMSRQAIACPSTGVVERGLTDYLSSH